jgi:N utilization substance protein A
MRGQRVKNIVRELNGERIDIIRWSEDIKEYIKAALSPAEISSIDIEKPSIKARVIVGDDQLSLAIGKQGQNVRLASKLTGWNIDIRSKKELKTIERVSILSIDGIGKKAKDILEESGFDTVDKIASSSVEKLKELPGIAEKSAKKMIESAKDVIRRLQEAEKMEGKAKSTNKAKVEKEAESIKKEAQAKEETQEGQTEKEVQNEPSPENEETQEKES